MSTLAFDLGGTHLRAGAVADGEVVAHTKVALDDKSPEGVARAMAQCAGQLPTTSGTIGVGIAAMVSQPHHHVENAPNLGWRQVDFPAIASQALGGRAVRLANDLDAICLGEATHGAAKGAQHVLCVYVGTGVGAGLLLDGRPYSGARGVGSELGHSKSPYADGVACSCGQTGCLEAITGGARLLQRLHDDVAANRAARVAALAAADDTSERPHLGHVDLAFAEGDAYATALWTTVANAIGDAVGITVTLLNPETIVWGGGVLERCPHLLAAIEDRVRHQANAVALPGLRMTVGTLGDAAGLLGAAAVAGL